MTCQFHSANNMASDTPPQAAVRLASLRAASARVAQWKGGAHSRRSECERAQEEHPFLHSRVPYTSVCVCPLLASSSSSKARPAQGLCVADCDRARRPSDDLTRPFGLGACCTCALRLMGRVAVFVALCSGLLSLTTATVPFVAHACLSASALAQFPLPVPLSVRPSCRLFPSSEEAASSASSAMITCMLAVRITDALAGAVCAACAPVCH